MKLYEVIAGKHHEYSNTGSLYWILKEAKGMSYALNGESLVLDEHNRIVGVYRNGKCVKRARIKVSSFAVSPVR